MLSLPYVAKVLLGSTVAILMMNHNVTLYVLLTLHFFFSLQDKEEVKNSKESTSGDTFWFFICNPWSRQSLYFYTLNDNSDTVFVYLKALIPQFDTSF